MNIFSSQKPSFTSLFSPSQNPNYHHSKSSLYFHHKSRPSSTQSSSPGVEFPTTEATENEIVSKKNDLVVRRPLMEVADDESKDTDNDEAKDALQGLTDFSKKLPIFEPKDNESGSPREKPLAINLDLALYRAKILLGFHPAAVFWVFCRVYCFARKVLSLGFGCNYRLAKTVSLS